MGRKSKQAGGNMPLTHYERTKKFVSSEYGTTSRRLAGHSQYQLGNCALSVTRIDHPNHIAMCSPSGYLYSEQAILEYLLNKTQEIKHQQAEYDKQQQMMIQKQNKSEQEVTKTKINDFIEAQKVIKKRKFIDEKLVAQTDLKRTSYWISNEATKQPKEGSSDLTTSSDDKMDSAIQPPPERPLSPFTEQPLRRKDIWPVQLLWDDDQTKLVCAISQKTIQSQQAIAYWIDKSIPGTIVLESVWNDIVVVSSKLHSTTSGNDVVKHSVRTAITMKCPNTGKKIKYTRTLQRSGTSFASSGQNIQVKQYRPTIT